MAAAVTEPDGRNVEIFFKNNKLSKVFNDGARLQKEYGAPNARIIRNRLAVLEAAATLADVPSGPPERRHLLVGDLAGSYAVDLQQPFRLIFCPKEPQARPGHDLHKITAIIITQVVDYHLCHP